MARCSLNAAMVCKTCPSLGARACLRLCSPPVLEVPVPNSLPPTPPEEHSDHCGESLSPTKDRMHVMCVEGHGRSICFEVKSSEEGLPEWVQKWMDDVAAGGDGRDYYPEDGGYGFEDEDSDCLEYAGEEVYDAVDSPGIPLVLLSDVDNDSDK
ncbi:hypothetical protein KC19_2G087100 [Ceratodon purpureus]|uniref:Uncharacterized protein n=1 Tax=Ceratodon purpureus TaxID=3225 RepID=A0A8T0IUJ4_CERPU|nr:hypothetical protein KC19_2G087100 [Ceratodon purpureus]